MSHSGIDIDTGIRYPLSYKEVIIINEQELLDMIVQERIQVLLKSLISSKADDHEYVSQLIRQVDVVLKHLPESDQDILNQYFEHLVNRMAEEEPCLYLGGLKDGMRIMKLIGDL